MSVSTVIEKMIKQIIITTILSPVDNSKFIFSLNNLVTGGNRTADIAKHEIPAINDDENEANPTKTKNSPKIQAKIPPNVSFLTSFPSNVPVSLDAGSGVGSTSCSTTPIAAPQLLQNFISSGFSVPQLLQNVITSPFESMYMDVHKTLHITQLRMSRISL